MTDVDINAMETELKSLKLQVQALESSLANAKLKLQDQTQKNKDTLKRYTNESNCFDEKEFTLFVLAFYQVDEYKHNQMDYDFVRRKMPEIMSKIRETIKLRCPYIKSIGNACECGAFCQNMLVPIDHVYTCTESLRNLLIEVKDGEKVLGNWILFQNVHF